jgi:hypothetical protein
MNDVIYRAREIREDNILQLRPVTQKVILPLEGVELDLQTSLYCRLEDLANDEAKLEKQLHLIRMRKATIQLQIDEINERRVRL